MSAPAARRLVTSGPAPTLRGARWWKWYLAFAVVAMVVEVGAPSDMVSTVAYLGLATSAVVMTGVGIGMNDPAERLAWFLLATGLLLFLGGDVYFAVSKLVWHIERPFPSSADVLFLASYPALAAGLLLLTHCRYPRGDRVVLIDSLIIATAAALLLWVYVIAPTSIRTDGPALERVLAAGYPLLDVLLLGVTMRLALGPGSRQASYYFLGLAMLSLVAADVVYAAYQLAPSGTLPAVEPADLGWLGFYLFVAVAALHPSMRTVAAEASGDDPASRARLLLLGMGASVTPGVLAVEYARSHTQETVVIVVAMVVLFVLVMARISELVAQLEDARRTADTANDAKGAFLSAMSHELRTPMHAVIAVSELLGMASLEPEQRALTEVIIQSGKAMLGVVDEVLDFSKIEAGMMELEQRSFDLGPCIESALDLVAADACAKGVQLAYEVEAEVPPKMVGDRLRIGQVLLNLLTNAVKFTEQGEVVLTVAALGGSSGVGGGPTIDFAVRDTGIGIPADAMNDLFRSYSQGAPSTTRRYGGTGLGLAISQRLASAMGGRIWVESEVGRGCTFHLTMLARPAPHADQPDREKAVTALDRRRLLVVDDNATTQGILDRLAARWGMVVAVVANPSDATLVLEEGRAFDAVILDVGSADTDDATYGPIGWMLGHTTTPVVALVPIDRLSDPRLRDASPAAVVPKPVKPARLHAALVAAVGAGAPRSPAGSGPTGIADPVSRRVGSSSPTTARILVADDNPVNQQVAVLLLDRLGYRADLAGDGDGVLGALRRRHYDVVLMDLAMPGMDGLDASRRIREEWPAAEQPSIIALTASADKDERERVLAIGVDEFLTKPIDIEQLADALSRCLLRGDHPVGDSPPPGGTPQP